MLGVSEEHFWDSNHTELKPYRKMDEMRRERMDFEMWMMGNYVLSAVQTAVSGVLAGKKSKAKYIETPLLSKVVEERESDPQADFTKFCAYAVVFNENFKGKEGQGNK